MSAEPLHRGSPLQRLPLVTLYLTERCNSKCVTCDYWRHGRIDMTLARLAGMLPALRRLQTRVALLSGGEPLLNPDWEAMARLLKDNGQKVWLLTSGLSLAKHASRVAELFESVTVSLDGTNGSTYAAIRGLDAFDKVCEGIRRASDAGVPVSVRVTLQRGNFRELPLFVEVARQAGARQVSFLAVDVGNPHAFGRADDARPDVGLRPEDLPELEGLIAVLEREHAEDFKTGLIAESPQKLRRLVQYFAAVDGKAPFPPVRCNAPEFSAVVGVHGQVQPCFFIEGPQTRVPAPGATGVVPGTGVAATTAPAPGSDSAATTAPMPGSDSAATTAPTPGSTPAAPMAHMPWAPAEDLAHLLNTLPMATLRADIAANRRPECARCVCSMYRPPSSFEDVDFLQARQAAA